MLPTSSKAMLGILIFAIMLGLCAHGFNANAVLANVLRVFK